MELGMIGLGRMGANIVRRLLRAGHRCVGYDHHAETVRELVGEGAASFVKSWNDLMDQVATKGQAIRKAS